MLWLVCAISLLIALLIAANLWRAYDALRRQGQETLLSIAHASADQIDVDVQDLQSSLLTLAASDPLNRVDDRGSAAAINAFSAKTGIPLLLIGADGYILTSQSVPAARVAAVEAAARKSMAEHRPALTNLLPDSPQQAQAVALVVPSHRQDGSDFALAGLLTQERLHPLAQPPRFSPPGVSIVILDRDGHIVSRSSAADPPVEFRLTTAIRTASAGILYRTGKPDDSTAMIAFAHTTWGFAAVAIVPMDPFGAASRPTLLATLVVSLMVFVGGLIVAIRFNRRLVQALRAVGQYGPPDAIRSGLREIDDLAERLNVLARQRDDTEASLRDLLEKVDLAAIMAREMDGTIRFWSKGCVRMYGWLPEEALGKSSHALLRTQFACSLAEIEQTLLATGEWTGDMVHRRRDGVHIVAAAQTILRRGATGNSDIVIESLVDVTALRDAEATVRAINQNLEQRVQAEIAAREAAQRTAEQHERIRVLGQLAGGIAHDFNNILQAIAGSAALIARRPNDADAVARFAEIITEAATRGASITRRILLLARRGDLKPEPIDAAALLTGVRQALTPTLGPSIRIDLDIAPDLPRLLSDRGQLEAALLNLATNSGDAMPDGGTLRMTAEAASADTSTPPQSPALPSGIYVRLAVSDTGIGMDAATLGRVGEPFFTTKPFGQGTGLGLSMVKGFIEQSQGGLTIISKPTQGTTVSLWLPAAAEPPPQNGPLAVADRGAQILLVDDDSLARDTVAEQLEDLGHQVLSATGGADALSILRAASPVDLMITDLAMPGMSGIMLIRQAREVRPRLPAILLTGYAADAASIAQQDTIQADYALIRKPASSAVLQERIGELLSFPA